MALVLYTYVYIYSSSYRPTYSFFDPLNKVLRTVLPDTINRYAEEEFKGLRTVARNDFFFFYFCAPAVFLSLPS